MLYEGKITCRRLKLKNSLWTERSTNFQFLIHAKNITMKEPFRKQFWSFILSCISSVIEILKVMLKIKNLFFSLYNHLHYCINYDVYSSSNPWRKNVLISLDWVLRIYIPTFSNHFYVPSRSVRDIQCCPCPYLRSSHLSLVHIEFIHHRLWLNWRFRSISRKVCML